MYCNILLVNEITIEIAVKVGLSLYQCDLISFPGGLMLLGQIADAISTPFVGFCSDRGSVFCCCGYGRRKSWHLLGKFLHLFFPLIQWTLVI